MSVTLRKRKNADGTTSLRLDIYNNGKRTIETLKNLQLAKPSNVSDREGNKEKLNQAEKIAVTRAAELDANNYGMVTEIGKKTEVIAWMQGYIDSYTKKDKRNMQGACNRFRDFLIEEKKHQLTFINLTALMIEDFIEYLENKSIGEGANSYYARFKKMIRHAYRRGLTRRNIIDEVERKVKGKAAKKETLTIDEIKKLANTTTDSLNVRNAALFSLMTGLRWVDLKALTWERIRLNEQALIFEQSKTGQELRVPLNIAAIKLLGPKGEPKEKVFNLPSANGANKTLKAWVKRAKIDKNIKGWHNLRHSFGTNLIFNDVDILTASKLLGHTSLKHTNRYVTAAEEMKGMATDKLNIDL